MVQAKTHFNSIEEYAAVDPGNLPEGRYELVNGVIVEMGAENCINIVIAGYLFSVLLKFVPYYLIHRGTEIQVDSTSVTCRQPDLMVFTEDGFSAMRLNQRSLITLDMPNPSLVIEVVSPSNPGNENYDRDYLEKPKEYAVRGISEYWLIDPNRAVVMVLQLDGSVYKTTEFRGTDLLPFPTCN